MVGFFEEFMRKRISILLITALVFVLNACSPKLELFKETFYGTFDTSIGYLSYARNKEDFDKQYKALQDEFTRLHKLYDNFHTYEGINNIKTINDNAGKGPIEVDKDLFSVIKFSIDNYEKTDGKLNIAMGAVIKLWTNARNHNVDPSLSLGNKQAEIPDEEKIIPSDEELAEAGKHSNIKDVVLDEKNMTVELKDPKMSLDLGAVGKGYATELVAKKLESIGVKNASINAGGNIRSIGTPGDGRDKWGIGIQNPNLESSESLEVLFIGQTSVVTSGDYQRYFEKDGIRYHHIIDPKTLKPAGEFNSVTIVTPNSGVADYLSTVIFLSSKEEAERIIKEFDDVKVLWNSEKEGKTFTPELAQYMKSQGAKASQPK